MDNETFLLIDDQRDMTVDRTCRSFDDGIKALQEQVWTHLYLDHDLDDSDPNKTGYGICNFLEQHPECRPVNIYLITMNPVGRDRMGAALAKMGYTAKSNLHFQR